MILQLVLGKSMDWNKIYRIENTFEDQILTLRFWILDIASMQKINVTLTGIVKQVNYVDQLRTGIHQSHVHHVN